MLVIPKVSSPAPPLIVSEVVGLVKVTLSPPTFESIVEVPPPASTSEIVSVEPLNVNTRFTASRLSVMGSKPV